MAITNIHPIYVTLSKAIDYILNEEKTDNGMLVSTLGCTPNGKKASKEFDNIRKLGTGKTTILAQHLVQSFKPGEITPEQAHQIGLELADKLLGNSFQYIIATHIDKHNIHNHIIFNEVNCFDYLSFETTHNRGRRIAETIQNYNDELCLKNGLSVIQNPKLGKGKSYYEWQQDKLGKSWMSKLRYAIDETIMQSSNFDEFLKKIKEKEIECIYTPENVIKIKFRMTVNGQEKFSRGRTLGWYYDEPQIRKRIEQYQFLQTGESGRDYKTKIIDTSKDIFQTSKGLLHWADLQNMKEASRLINFLTTQNLHSQQELESKATATYNERMILVSNLNKMQNKIDEMSDTIKLLKAYKKYKPIYELYQKSFNKSKYKKDNALAIDKYENIVKTLTKLYPNKTLPNLENLEKERRILIDKRTQMNNDYKKIVNNLKEIEYAQTSIQEYLKTVSNAKSKKSELE